MKNDRENFFYIIIIINLFWNLKPLFISGDSARGLRAFNYPQTLLKVVWVDETWRANPKSQSFIKQADGGKGGGGPSFPFTWKIFDDNFRPRAHFAR